MNNSAQTIIVRYLGSQDYLKAWQAMQQFTQNRQDQTLDEMWLLEHAPVYTQGQNGKTEHILQTTSIPIIATDRGGQVTYHGPGQLMIYTLIDLKRKKFTIRDLVTRLEQTVMDFLTHHHIQSYAKREAPGVYIQEKKICSIGLRVRRGCSYHGIAFNLDMDLAPFQSINPCGFKNLQMTQLRDFLPTFTPAIIRNELTNYLMKNLGYTSADYVEGDNYGC